MSDPAAQFTISEMKTEAEAGWVVMPSSFLSRPKLITDKGLPGRPFTEATTICYPFDGPYHHHLNSQYILDTSTIPCA